jgi:hypothetical protein
MAGSALERIRTQTAESMEWTHAQGQKHHFFYSPEDADFLKLKFKTWSFEA